MKKLESLKSKIFSKEGLKGITGGHFGQEVSRSFVDPKTGKDIPIYAC